MIRWICLWVATAGTCVVAQKQMAITVDDLPFQSMSRDTLVHRDMNRRIIGHVTAAGVPAIGFVNESKLFVDGRLSEFQVATLALWTGNGLSLGNHTFSHQDYNRTPHQEFFADIERGETVTRTLMGNPAVKYFRHPYLRRGNSTEKVRALERYLAERGYTEAPVTIDNSEWIYARAYEKAWIAGDTLMQRRLGASYVAYMTDKTRYFERIADSLFARPIAHVLLIHANALNATYLGDLIVRLRSDGYGFISLAEALTDPAYQSADTVVAGRGISWLSRWAITRGKDKSLLDGDPPCPDFVQAYAGVKE